MVLATGPLPVAIPTAQHQAQGRGMLSSCRPVWGNRARASSRLAIPIATFGALPLPAPDDRGARNAVDRSRSARTSATATRRPQSVTAQPRPERVLARRTGPRPVGPGRDCRFGQRAERSERSWPLGRVASVLVRRSHMREPPSADCSRRSARSLTVDSAVARNASSS